MAGLHLAIDIVGCIGLSWLLSVLIDIIWGLVEGVIRGLRR